MDRDGGEPPEGPSWGSELSERLGADRDPPLSAPMSAVVADKVGFSEQSPRRSGEREGENSRTGEDMFIIQYNVKTSP